MEEIMSSRTYFSEKLKAYRRSIGLTQDELARQLQFSPETISAWERGKRNPSIRQIPFIARLLNISPEELIQSMNIAQASRKRHWNQEFDFDDLEHLSTVKEYLNQEACESHIRHASHRAKIVKILTIRGEKYFLGTRSLLFDLYAAKQTKDSSIKVLVLSPESAHITEELARNLGHNSAEDVRRKMRLVFEYLRQMSELNENFEVKCYQETPNFKILLFDDSLFVAAFVNPKNDHNSKMFCLTREGNPLFAGFEKFFDELWDRSSYV